MRRKFVRGQPFLEITCQQTIKFDSFKHNNNKSYLVIVTMSPIDDFQWLYEDAKPGKRCPIAAKIAGSIGILPRCVFRIGV